MEKVVVVAAKRTPIGSFGGSLSGFSAATLGSYVIKALIGEVGIANEAIEEVIMGQVLTAGDGQNPARQAAVKAGLSYNVPAYIVNQVCGSGLRAVALGFQSIALGESRVSIVGGQENMSRSIHGACLRPPHKMGNVGLADTMITDGLWDAFCDYHMGVTAENIAKRWKISRAEQDEFALWSQQKASYTQKNNHFAKQIVSLEVQERKKTFNFDADEYIRHEATLESLEKLKPAFDKKQGTVTAGNASGLNDGAAALLLMSEKEAFKNRLTPLCRVVSWASCGVNPEVMGTGPIPSSHLALKKANWQVGDLDLIEANEAFAAQAICVNREMGWDVSKVNVNGGAIALGHPIGASGARILVDLVHELSRKNLNKGLATLCVGGGMGVSVCVER